ncbi:LysR family transcriptional regulator [Pseudooceanicola sp. CBS1P-1]|uniref:LysR family transcriptional regulator n=1 Tax=Pseudooceanicola albus TaxID=2692189 RepID=A0A6L7G4Q5_9RHOB|nr:MULTISPECIES: LysR family transcriptional regulator [Pseudooceanicola]MBT9385234.1 LysR family transcriptional regulator [Pseudooceanicola endophyticus]MXN18682.1 LysR family transcriptional regulator [Pseudooceanicola albus]
MLHARMLSYLDEVARCGSIRKAAKGLNVSSTSINRQILALEAQLGQPIFERMPNRLRLTAAGEVLIEHVRETLRNFERLQLRLDGLKGLQRGQLKVATTLGLAGGPIPGIVQRFLADHPGATLDLQALFADNLPGSTLSGESDLALGFNLLPHPGLKTVLHYEVPIGLVVHRDHDLAGQSEGRAHNLIGYPLVLPAKNMTLRSFIDIALARLPDMPVPVVETNSIEMLKQLLRDGVSVSLLNPLDVGEEIARGELRYLPLRPATTQTLKLVARSKGMIDPLTSRFIEHLRRELDALMAGQGG